MVLNKRGTKPVVRSELVQKVLEAHPGLTLEVAEAVVESVFRTIVEALEHRRRVELRGFGSFVAKSRDAKMGHNPRTGELIPVPAKFGPRFKAGKPLLALLNQKP
jgi:integration host factor subunit beta